ncbi:MAG TPA: IspD/TarI family cytidylyltransferase [Euzebyales bacterium]|nr:IspD/TarI family cytidylyltransferase [Euzebyales bacterium]
MSTAAIVLAGGSGSRLARPGPAATNKVFVPVGGRPLIAWSLRTFAASQSITHVVVVARAGEHDQVNAVIADEPVGLPLRITTGGATRHASERAGLEAIATEIGDGTIDVVLIHDAARPFAGSALIDRVAATARAVGGAVPALPLGDGVYRIDADGGIVNQPSNLYRVQTPQGFAAQELLEAYRRADADGFTGVDTSETVEHYGDLDVGIVPGEPTNIKVTFVDDLEIAEEIAAAQV